MRSWLSADVSDWRDLASRCAKNQLIGCEDLARVDTAFGWPMIGSFKKADMFGQ
jgi:hypothetical protein